MNNPLVSVIIPMYNSEKYIVECLCSVIVQEYQNIEVIIIDDGSTDNSFAICKNLSADHHCLKILHKENGGVSSARNLGLKKCSGEFITFVDADDFIEPNHILSLVKALEGDCDCSICGYCLDFNQKSDTRVFDNMLDMDMRQAMFNMLNPGLYQGFLCNKMFRKSVIEVNCIRLREDIFYCEDLLFCAEYFRFCHKICCNELATYHYRQHNESAVNRKDISAKQLEHMLTGVTALRKCAELYYDCSEISALASARAATEYAHIFRRAYSSVSDKSIITALLQDLRNCNSEVLHSSLNAKEKIKFLSTCVMPKIASRLWTARETRFL